MKKTKILEQIQALYNFNAFYQPVSFLQMIQKIEHGYICMQNEAQIRIFIENNDIMIALSGALTYDVPTDEILPKWDLQEPYASWFKMLEKTPDALLISNKEGNLESPWLATTWWPHEGLTDCIDNPKRWVTWWWYEVMKFSNPPPDWHQIAQSSFNTESGDSLN